MLGETPPPIVRVIAGALGGRRLVAPRGRDTRPTSDRVREALFMTLEPLSGLRVVDLFSGSGALGIEALSRGAERADFVDFHTPANRALKANLGSLELEGRATSWALELPRGLKQIAAVLGEADLVFLDPPYGGALSRTTLAMLSTGGTLKRSARVVVEHHTKDVLPEEVGELTRVRQRRYGETMVSIYRNQRHERGEGR